MRALLRRGTNDEQVAEDVVRAQVDGESVLLVDILGNVVKIENAFIEEVDIQGETLRLSSSPILSLFLAFMAEYGRCESEERYTGEIGSRWSEIKSLGDSMVHALQSKNSMQA